jgi:hypothetical protein
MEKESQAKATRERGLSNGPLPTCVIVEREVFAKEKALRWRGKTNMETHESDLVNYVREVLSTCLEERGVLLIYKEERDRRQ